MTEQSLFLYFGDFVLAHVQLGNVGAHQREGIRQSYDHFNLTLKSKSK